MQLNGLRAWLVVLGNFITISTKSNLSSSSKVVFQHVLQSANDVADMLAMKGALDVDSNGFLSI